MEKTNKEVVFYRHYRTGHAPKGGLTFKVCLLPEIKMAIFSVTKCRDDELFCYKTGRESATEKMKALDVYNIYRYNPKASFYDNLVKANIYSGVWADVFPYLNRELPKKTLNLLYCCY